MNNGRQRVFVVMLFAAFLLLSFADIPQSKAATHSVHMSGLQFSPTPITISFGDTVEWTNDEVTVHQVTIQGAPGGSSPDLNQGGKWSYAFNSAGTFKYRCVYHSTDFDTGMVGVVIVQNDVDPPEVTDVVHIREYPSASEYIEIRATVTDPSGVATVKLYHCYEPPYTCLSPKDMSLYGGDVYNTTIGPFPEGAMYVTYHLEAKDGQGNWAYTEEFKIYMPNYIEVGMSVKPASVYTMNAVWVNGTAVYGFRNATATIPNSTAPAAYSTVNVSIKGTGIFRLGTTDLNGDYSLKITMPSVPGSRVFNVSLSNRSISGWNETTKSVQQLKILHSPQLSKTVAYPDQTIWVNGTATYNNGSKAVSSNVSVHIDGQDWFGIANSVGYYSIPVTAPGVSGSYDVVATASNQTVLVSNTTILEILVTDVPVPDITISADDISISDPHPIVNRDFSVDVKLHNTGTQDALDFYVDVRINGALEHQEYVATLGQGMDESFAFIWNTTNGGNITIAVLLDPLNTLIEAVESNNNASKIVYIDGDFDGDGVGDELDDDDDNDGHPDVGDRFPYDPTEWVDTDRDGIGDNRDIDDDGDGYPDWRDRFPLDKTEWLDTDDDGIGNDKDEDDDNDGTPDLLDEFPLNPLEWKDSDNDGVGDNMDLDDDNDGMPDLWEVLYGLYPNNPEDAELDHDGDGLTNIEEYEMGTSPKDKDTDDDGIWDSEDYAPIDPKVRLSPHDQALETTMLLALAATAIAIILTLLMLTTRRNREE